jgi:DUF1680 family protein
MHRLFLTRRKFLALTAASAVVPRLRALTPQIHVRLREFGYGDVRLTGGPLKAQYDRIFASYLALENDRLLKVYRQRAGLPAPGDDMGGWYDADGFVPGHSLGQYISGLSRYACTTGEPLAYAKVNQLVAGFAATLGSDNHPFASPVASTTWPCYILDKHEIGLLDAFQLAGVEQAKELLPRVVRGALPYLPDHTYDRGPQSPKKAPYDETYILSENLFNVWEVTGDRFYFDLAKKYLLNTEYYLPLAQGKDILPGKHAYSHVISLSSAAKAYLVLGDSEYLEAIQNAWQMLETSQRYASGGWGPNETFVKPHEGKLFESLTTTQDHFETPCGFYAQAKLTRYLLRFTADGRYGDSLERALYNTILGARDPDGSGNYFYYSSYHPLAQKGYYQKKWPCCSGTLVQGVADYVLDLYFHHPEGVFVNLFAPSQVRWSYGGIPVRITQSTAFPFGEEVRLHLEMPGQAEFSISLRVPFWASRPPELRVNGKSVQDATLHNGFLHIRRKWKDGDTLDYTLSRTLRVEAIDDKHPETVALLYGPLMLAAAAPPADLAEIPLDLPRSLRPLAGADSVFLYALPQTDVQLRPWFTLQDERYTTYFRLQKAPA